MPNKPRRSCKGFTLIELLIVIAIIAILATIGFAVYNGIQKTARDARRKAEIDSISKALEINKNSSGYQPLSDSQFAGGGIPAVDPAGYSYCINTTSPYADPTVGWTTTCPSNFVQLSSTVPTAGTSGWKVCASLEKPSGSWFCKSNTQ